MPAAKSIDDYIASYPDSVRIRLEAIRALIRSEVPRSVEVISYGIPTFDLDGKHLVHFAGFKHHVGFYPGARWVKAFAAELKGYKHAAGSVQFPHDQELPFELVRKAVRFRVAQAAEPKRARTGARKRAAAKK